MNTEVKKLFGGFVSEALKLVDLGFHLEKVDDLTQSIRIGICNRGAGDCFDSVKRQCNECGCKMDFKTSLKYDPFKINTSEEDKILIECPLQKW